MRQNNGASWGAGGGEAPESLFASRANGHGRRPAGEDPPKEGALAEAAARRRVPDWESVARRSGEQSSGSRPTRASKRSLVAVSHAIERALLAGPLDTPTVVFAFFQRLAYFEREREVYDRLVRSGAHVLISFTDGQRHDIPEGAHSVTLDGEEPLADEWTVVALSPRAGAFLVATDQHGFDASERDLEASRLFLGRWGYARTQAAGELARLRLGLGDRLDPELARVVDKLLAESLPAGGTAASSAGTPSETWATTSLFHMVERMQDARAGTRVLREQLADAHFAAAARAAATIDPHSGLTNPDFLDRWSNTGGTTALPIGVGFFDVAGLDQGEQRHGSRAAYHAARRVAASLTEPLGPVDAAVRLSERAFAVVIPGASSRHLATVCDDVTEQLALASHGYPNVDLRPSVATIVTTARPLPLADLHEALAHLDPEHSGPLDAGRTPGGDRITVMGPQDAPQEGLADAEAEPAAPKRPSPRPAEDARVGLPVRPRRGGHTPGGDGQDGSGEEPPDAGSATAEAASAPASAPSSGSSSGSSTASSSASSSDGDGDPYGVEVPNGRHLGTEPIPIDESLRRDGWAGPA